MKRYIIFCAIFITSIILLASFREDELATRTELGRMLFFDPILSKNKTISCATCHKPDFAYADTLALSIGIHGNKGIRNTPSAMNLSLLRSFFWDGRASTLEEQALEPITNPLEMDLDLTEAVARLRNDENYNRYFKRIFDSEPTEANLAKAIASFERSLETSDSPFDNWKYSDDTKAVSEDVKRGFTLFNGKGKCVKCHFGADFTLRDFRNNGLFNGKELNDSGRIKISGIKDDIGKFKTPGLRNVAITGPYMHNGMLKTLMEVIDFYNEPDKVVPNSVNRDSILSKPLGLSKQEKADIEAFLRSLTDKQFNNGKRVMGIGYYY